MFPKPSSSSPQQQPVAAALSILPAFIASIATKFSSSISCYNVLKKSLEHISPFS